MKIYSKRFLIDEIKNTIFNENIFPWNSKEKIWERITSIFINKVNIFISNNYNADWEEVKKLTDNVFEFRIKLTSNILLRIIFYLDKIKNEILLITWFFVKNNKGTYKKQESNEVDLQYKIEINKALSSFEEFKKEKTLYVFLNKEFDL